MRVTVTIPDRIFRTAERMGLFLKRSRSRLYTDALKEYVNRHESGGVSKAMNRVHAGGHPSTDEFVSACASRVLESIDW